MLISGDDLLTGPLYSIGAVGIISVLANPFADMFKIMKDGAFDGDFDQVREALFKLLEINPLMYSESNPVGVKQVLKELGVCENYVRLPLVEATSELQEKIAEAISKIYN